MIAIVSDIHANIAALNAVLADIREKGVEEIFCLGDVIGYGPDPIPCLEIASEFSLVLCGNHEEALLYEPKGFNQRARAAIDWTRTQVDASPRAAEYWEMLGNLPRSRKDEQVTYVHGTPRRPTNEYLFPKDAAQPDKIEGVFAKFPRACFAGHTHMPGIFLWPPEFVLPEETFNVHILDDSKAFINVGSVGQPRDGDPRASYVTFDGEAVVFRRVEYDVAATANRIFEIEELDDALGHRLQDGR